MADQIPRFNDNNSPGVTNQVNTFNQNNSPGVSNHMLNMDANSSPAVANQAERLDDNGNLSVLRTSHQLLLFSDQTQKSLDAHQLAIYLELGYTATFIAELTGDEPGRDGGDPDDWDQTVHTIPAVDVAAFRCPLNAEQLFEMERRIRKEQIDL
ncbi:uncharacterized protein LOC124337092 isoform X2 [Daphnia pulicaria]|uniref:uncharacterized protein LOC124337092 isoform X2 n=1 Tax=Daphnia pulicaria TaxID=35523 RepID=UPI001EEA66A4|nr:uncharacterized protein LOC124337092 isoform X2 [Daphnia pulicaria]